MLAYVLLRRIVNFRKLRLCEPQILVSKTNGNFSNSVLILIYYEFVID